ncbi:MAG TPA: substrate binding domain-containing protein, partial [Pseudonocardia sp.]|nr:substrate binding domain-containing protein [Pseudonocardia sp.]
RLLHRTTRSLALTEAGRAYHGRVAAALAELGDAAAAAVEAREVPRGTVRLSTPPDVGAEVLPALIAAFVARYPEVRVEIELSADPRDLVEGGYDLALRGGRPRGPSLTAHKLQDNAFRLYAAPAYLARAGVPGGPGDLAGHTCVLFRPWGGRCRWRLRRDGDGLGGERVEVSVTGPVAANDLSFVRRAAVAGAGIALLPELVGAAAVRGGGLEGVLPELSADGLPLYLVHPAARHLPLAVRALRDHLLEHFPR